MNAAQLKSQTEACLAASKKRLAEFLASPEAAPVETIIDSYDAIRKPLNEVEGWIQLLAAVHPEVSVRDEAEGLEREVSRWTTELSQNRETWSVLARYAPEDAGFAEGERFLKHTLRDFKRSGVDRETAVRERLLKLSEEMLETGQEFDRNITEDVRELVVEDGRAGLVGLPDDFIRAHEEDDQGRVRISTDPQDAIPFLSFADREDLREGLVRERYLRATPRNLEVLKHLLELRHEYATLLGYEHWAAYAFEDLMSGEGQVVETFIERCAELAREGCDGEIAEQLATKRELGGAGATVVQEWDRAYLTEKIKESKYQFDAQEARAYFAYDNVVQGVLDVASALYGVEFVQRKDADVWHPEVQCWEATEAGQVVARFYLDMHPRDGKYKHAAMFPLVNGYQQGPAPEGALVCNFPAPGPGEPGLLLHDQVTTIFHEFGHLLHHLFSNGQRYLRFSGLSCEWDFVEVPSQLFEEWAWDPKVLAGFALHHETGESIPANLVERMRAADEYGRALGTRQQMAHAALSLGLHAEDPADFEPMDLMLKLRERLSPFPHVEGTCFLASFGHLNGYSAIYYTYMWSLVIAKDLYSRFEADPMNAAVAADYRKHIIGRGGELDASELVRGFLGRDYSTEAWERSVRCGAK